MTNDDKPAHEFRYVFTGGDARSLRALAIPVYDARLAVIEWARKDTNQYELKHRDGPQLYLRRDGWVLHIVVRYVTASGDGDAYDIRRMLERIFARFGLTFTLEEARQKASV